MSILFAEGFDLGFNVLNTDLKSPGVATATPGLVAGRNSVGGVGMNSTNRAWYYTNPASADDHATALLAFAFFNNSSSPGAGLMAGLKDRAGNVICQLYQDATGAIEIRSCTNNTVFTVRGTTTASVPVQAWTHVSLRATFGASGRFELAINGVLDLDLTLDNRRSGSTNTVATAGFGNFFGANSVAVHQFDDFVFGNGAGSVNNSLLPDVAVRAVSPDSNGNSSQWVGSDGNSVDNYLLVDETTPNLADYVESSTAGQLDLYGFGTATAGSTILGVVLQSILLKTDAGSRTVKSAVRSSATNAYGPTHTLSTTAVPYPAVFEQNPIAAANWTVAGFNDAEFGVEVVT